MGHQPGFRRPVVGLVSVLIAIAWVMAAQSYGETRPIDLEQSSLTVKVSKSGLFAAFADNHLIHAPIANGSISVDPPLAIDVTIRSGDLRVIDPNLSPAQRTAVQVRMLSPEVLDITKYPEISFASTTIAPTGPDRWQVNGHLAFHGQMRTITFPVVHANGKYRGDVVIRQRDFGMEPITVAGGTVKVKDEITVQFEIAN
jgi:hypothetical protein